MTKVEYHLNDYVINEDNKICKVVGTRFVPCDVYMAQSTQLLTLLWWEDKGGSLVSHLKEVSSVHVYGWSFTVSILEKIGFKKGESVNTMVYRDPVTRNSIVIDRTDGSVYAFKCNRHIMLDYVYADYVHDIQHIFDTVGIDFPCLDQWLLAENAKRKPPVKLPQY